MIVDITGTDDATVVSHKRYSIISEDDMKEAASRFQRSRRKVGRSKWF